MTAAVNPSRSPLLAWAGAGLVAAATAAAAIAPVGGAPRLADEASTALQVALTSAGDLAGLLNVPANLFIDMANIPYDLFAAPFSVEGLLPNSVDEDGKILDYQVLPNGDHAPVPDYSGALNDHGSFPDADTGHFDGAINNFAAALDYTGSWWVSSPTNIWGWDAGNPWNFTSMINLLLPIQALSEPLAHNLNTLMAAEFPIATDANKFQMTDILTEFKSLFNVPLSQLIHDYTFGEIPTTVLVGADADTGEGGDKPPFLEVWSGTKADLNPTFGLDEYMKHLMSNPADNELHDLPTLQQVGTALTNLGAALNLDFNPLVPGANSYLFAGAPELWGLPTALEGALRGVLNGELLTGPVPFLPVLFDPNLIPAALDYFLPENMQIPLLPEIPWPDAGDAADGAAALSGFELPDLSDIFASL